MGALFEWWNLPFTVPFALAVLYIVLAASGVAGVGDGDGATDGGATAEGSGEGGGEGGGEGDADADHEHGGGSGRLLDFVGLGRVPLAVVVQIFLLVWGFAGWAATSVLAPVLRAPALFFWPSLAIAAVAAVAATVLLARPLARWMPSSESYGLSKRQLAGRLGTVVLPVGPEGGLVHVRDERGNVHQLACHTDGALAGDGDQGAGGPRVIPKGAEVIVVSHDAASDRYLVVASDLPPERDVRERSRR